MGHFLMFDLERCIGRKARLPASRSTLVPASTATGGVASGRRGAGSRFLDGRLPALRTPGSFAGVSRQPESNLERSGDRRRRCQRRPPHRLRRVCHGSSLRRYGLRSARSPCGEMRPRSDLRSDGLQSLRASVCPGRAITFGEREDHIAHATSQNRQQICDHDLFLGTGDDLSRSFGSPGKRAVPLPLNNWRSSIRWKRKPHLNRMARHSAGRSRPGERMSTGEPGKAVSLCSTPAA